MNRKLFTAAAAVIALLSVAPASAGDFSQLIASAGLSAAEASTLTLDEIAAAKFSREGHDNRQEVIHRAVGVAGFTAASVAARSSRSGDGLSLDGRYIAMLNRNARGDERHTVVDRQAIVGDAAARRQLAAAAGLDPEVAEEASLDMVAANKFYRDSDGDDRVPVRP